MEEMLVRPYLFWLRYLEWPLGEKKTVALLYCHFGIHFLNNINNTSMVCIGSTYWQPDFPYKRWRSCSRAWRDLHSDTSRFFSRYLISEGRQSSNMPTANTSLFPRISLNKAGMALPPWHVGLEFWWRTSAVYWEKCGHPDLLLWNSARRLEVVLGTSAEIRQTFRFRSQLALCGGTIARQHDARRPVMRKSPAIVGECCRSDRWTVTNAAILSCAQG